MTAVEFVQVVFVISSPIFGLALALRLLRP